MRPKLLILSLLSLGLFGPLRAETEDAAPEAGTARDVILKADKAYNEKRHDEAVAGYRKFLDDFGTSPEAKPLLPHVRYNVVAALMQTQKFGPAVEAIEKARQIPEITPDKQENLSFWLGVSLMQTGEAIKAREALGEFMEKFPRSRRREDAALLSATLLLTEGNKNEAAAALSAIRKNPGSVHGGRAAVLELHSLIESGNNDAALELVTTMASQQDRITQLATFQTLALQLGEKLLEQDKPREAIRALQTISTHSRLLEQQQRRLEEIKKKLAAIESDPTPDFFARAQLNQVAREIEKELLNLQKTQTFDASVRFRMATAFHQQDRYRESALLLDDMLRQMKPDPVVETASLSALQSWLAVERHDKAIETSQLFEKNFPQSKQLPLVLYLRGTAQQRSEQFDEAVATFAALREKFPKSEQAPRAFFMQGFTQLQAERNEEAASTLEEFGKQYPDHELAEAANYWRGSALAFAKKFPEAREVLAAHVEKFPKGTLLGPAAFRHAYCAQSMKDYARAEAELKAYLEKYPDTSESNEARILLGDALLAQAKSDEGKKVYSDVPADAGRLHEDAQFKLAKVLKLEEDFDGLRALMGKYLADNPKSPRAAEALLIIGQSWKQQDQPEKAAAEYRSAIERFGNDPDAKSVEEMFVALGRYYQGESGRNDYLAWLREMRAKAEAEKKTTLAVRSIWALGQAAKKSDPELSAALFREASALAVPEKTNPLILADGAEAQLAGTKPGDSESANRREKGLALFRDLIKWHPRAAQKDRALAALAQDATALGNAEEAASYYAKLERDVPWSPLTGEALMARARRATAEAKSDEAAEALNKLLAVQAVPPKQKAEALLALGDLELARGKTDIAVPYYQRIYIMYGRWADIVAKAYLRSGEAFEKLNDKEAARRTYQEMLENEQVAAQPEANTARERLQKLGPLAGQSTSS